MYILNVIYLQLLIVGKVQCTSLALHAITNGAQSCEPGSRRSNVHSSHTTGRVGALHPPSATSPWVTFRSKLRTPWCAAVGQRTTPPQRTSRPTASLRITRPRARPGAPTSSPLMRSPTPLRRRQINDRHQRPRCEGALLARPTNGWKKTLRIKARASRALKEAFEHERGNAAFQHDLPCTPIEVPYDRWRAVTALGATTLPVLAIERRRARTTNRAGEGASRKRPSRPVLKLATVDARTVRPEHNLRTWAHASRALRETCECGRAHRAP